MFSRWFFNRVQSLYPNSCCIQIEKLLELLFWKVKTVYVLQVGANDGRLCDPLSKYVKKGQVRGVFLEPQKNMFESLKENLSNIEGAIPVNAALSDSEGRVRLFRVKEKFADIYPDLYGVASFSKQHVLKELLSNRKKVGLKKHDVLNAIAYEDVDTVTYQTLLERYPQLQKLDMLVIDAEGFDYEAVTLFPFERVLPKFIVYEHKHLSEHQKSMLANKLSQLGYYFIYLKNDVLAMHE